MKKRNWRKVMSAAMATVMAAGVLLTGCGSAKEGQETGNNNVETQKADTDKKRDF